MSGNNIYIWIMHSVLGTQED